jgi:predicted ATPase
MVAARIRAMATELALAAYRPRSGQDDALVRLLRDDLATLRRRGHVTSRAAPLIRTERGDLLVVLEWSSEHAVADAHEDPEVLAVWRRKDGLAEYICPRELAGADVPFARWAVVADL